MIVKVERYKEDKKQNWGWAMFDKISKILKEEEVYDFDLGSAIPEECHHGDYFVLDIFEKYIKVIKTAAKIRVVRLFCKLQDGSEYLIIFDTKAYICNDDGKTIEKIVANYL